MRISGLASGFDIDTMVKDLMRAERMPVEKLLQQRQIIEWQQEQFREINRSLFELRDKAFDLRLQSSFNTKKATSSNETAIGVTVSGAAGEGIYNIEVKQLASGAFRNSSSTINSYEPAPGKDKMTLKEQFSTNLWDDEKFLPDGEENIGVFNINGEDFEFDITKDTIFDIVNKINAKSEKTGVRAAYDAEVNRFFLSTTKTGSEAKIDLSGTKPNSYGAILLGSNGLKLGNVNEVTTGEDAVINFNGTELTRSSNSFSLVGLNLELQSLGSSTIRVSNDIDAIYDKIVDFINTYNSVIEKINAKLTESRYRDFPPLSEEQKNEMSEREIELWEEKAKSGHLRGDPILSNLLTNMRRALNDPVGIDSEIKLLAQIGIKTGSWFEGGKLHIDEGKLRQALTDDIETVQKLFTNSSENDAAAGIARRFYDAVVTGSKFITEKAGRDSYSQALDESYLGERLKTLNQRIDQWEERLVQIENRYWAQFTLMEQAIYRMNEQSMWLAQQFWM